MKKFLLSVAVIFMFAALGLVSNLAVQQASAAKDTQPVMHKVDTIYFADSP